jgi:hypothetical protein
MDETCPLCTGGGGGGDRLAQQQQPHDVAVPFVRRAPQRRVALHVRHVGSRAARDEQLEDGEVPARGRLRRTHRHLSTAQSGFLRAGHIVTFPLRSQGFSAHYYAHQGSSCLV